MPCVYLPGPAPAVTVANNTCAMFLESHMPPATRLGLMGFTPCLFLVTVQPKSFWPSDTPTN